MAGSDTSVGTISAAIEKEKLPWTAASNELTSLSAQEQQQRLGLVVTDEEHQRLAQELAQTTALEQRASFGVGSAVGAPSAVDWRNVNGANYVTSVKNQGNCGSCVSFCSCSTIEANLRIKLQNANLAVDLSEGFLQFCGGGSCSGWGLTSGLEYARTTGVTDEACMPYQATNMSCGSSRCADWQSRLTKIDSFTGHATMAARKDAIANIGPVLAGMEVWSDFFSYSSGVYVKSSVATRLSPPGYHCICVVGYDDAQGCWIIKNSWGTGWGESGFIRLGYGQADLLIDSSWMFYSVAMTAQAVWQGNVTVGQTYASRDPQNAWAWFQGLGWRRIAAGSPDGITNMLALFAQAAAKGKLVTILVDGSSVYQAYLV